MPRKEPKRKPLKPRRKRPKVDDPELVAAVMDAIRCGVPVDTACILAGVSERTYYDWQARGKRDVEAGRATKWSKWAQEIQRARAEAHAPLAAGMFTMAKAEPRVLLSLLARLYPETWGKPGERMSREQESRLHDAKIARIQAEATLAEARAEQARAQGGGPVVLFPTDLLEDMPLTLRTAFGSWLQSRGVGIVSPPRLGEGVSQADVDAASPSGVVVDAGDGKEHQG